MPEQHYVSGTLPSGLRLTVTQPKRSDVEPLLFSIRRPDLIECMRLLRPGESLTRALHSILETSIYARVAKLDGAVVAMWGLVSRSTLSPIGQPWCLTTVLVNQHRKLFIGYSRRFLNEMLAICPRLEVYVDAEYKAAVRWMRWLGFELTEFSIEGHPFFMAIQGAA